MISILDASVLYAVVDADDDDHDRCREVLERADLEFIIPSLVVAEVAYLVGKRLGPTIEAAFVRSLRDYEVEAPQPDDWASIADMVDRYSNFPLGSADASVAVLADRLGTDLIATLDRRHFRALRSSHGTAYRLLPE